MSDKKTCPRCGQQARQYVDGSFEKHRVYDKRRKTVFSICTGKPPLPIKKEK